MEMRPGLSLLKAMFTSESDSLRFSSDPWEVVSGLADMLWKRAGPLASLLYEGEERRGIVAKPLIMPGSGDIDDRTPPPDAAWARPLPLSGLLRSFRLDPLTGSSVLPTSPGVDALGSL